MCSQNSSYKKKKNKEGKTNLQDSSTPYDLFFSIYTEDRTRKRLDEHCASLKLLKMFIFARNTCEMF